MALFRDFHAGNLPLFNLNFWILTLLPKEQVEKKSTTQTIVNSLQGYQTLSNGLLAQKLYLGGSGHTAWNNPWVTQKKQKGIILKLDFEKAHDKVNWAFL
jgi:hypothetical protein